MFFEYLGSIAQMLTGGIIFVASILMWKYRDKPEVYKAWRSRLILFVAVSGALELGLAYFLQKKNSQTILSLKNQIECRTLATTDFANCKTGFDNRLCQAQFDQKILECENAERRSLQ